MCRRGSILTWIQTSSPWYTACWLNGCFVAILSTCAPREPVTIFAFAPSMRHLYALVVLLSIVTVVPAGADARDDAKKQVEFGISVAQRGLWREAIYRWERAAAIDPTYAAAQNNLGIAYEHEGEMEKARAAYERALELEPSNEFIRQNYELFKEINDRTNLQDPV